MKNKIKYIRKLVDPGIPIIEKAAGAAFGSTLGFFYGGLPGTAIGAAGGQIFADQFYKIGEEFRKRYLSKRESVRIGAVAGYALERIKTNLENNMQVRKDDFFNLDPVTDRSAADEILEGTLNTAKNEHEEKKLHYLGNLVANIPFHPEIDRYQANYLLRIAGRLSYRQFCILALFERKLNHLLSMNNPDLGKMSNQNDLTLIQEIDEMMIMNLLISSRASLIGMRNLTPGEIKLRELGKTLHLMMNLDEINYSETDTLAGILSDPV